MGNNLKKNEEASANYSVVSYSLQLYGLYPTRLLCPWNSPSKNSGVGCHSFRGIFLTQGSNPGLPHCRQILYCLSHQGSPNHWKRVDTCICVTMWSYLLHSMWDLNSLTRNQTHVPCIARQILNNRTTREIPHHLFFFFKFMESHTLNLYLFLAVLDLPCCSWAFSSWGKWGPLSTCQCSGFSLQWLLL